MTLTTIDRGKTAIKLVQSFLARGSIARGCCATIMSVAAMLKAYESVTDPSLGILHGSRLFYSLLIEYELLLSTWLISGAAPYWSRRAGILTFAVFSIYSIYQATSGAASCDCFGSLRINPSWTSAMDFNCILMLWLWRPSNCTSKQFVKTTLLGIGGVSSVALILIVEWNSPKVDGLVASDTFVLVQPTQWVGKPLPIANQIDIGDRLVGGDWITLFYRHDCHKCQHAIVKYNQLAKDRSQTKIALIEVPPCSSDQQTGHCYHGRIVDPRQWYITTPLEITLKDGLVIAVRPE